MYYFGTNLDDTFSVPEFWPKPGQTHIIPFEKEEISEELERLRKRRLAARARRLELEGKDGGSVEQTSFEVEQQHTPSPLLQTLEHSGRQGPTLDAIKREGTWDWFSRSK